MTPLSPAALAPAARRLLESLRLAEAPVPRSGALLVFHTSTPDHLSVFLEQYLTQHPLVRVRVLTWMTPEQSHAECPTLAELTKRHHLRVRLVSRRDARARKAGAAILLHSLRSSAPMEQVRLMRRGFATAATTRKAVINGDGSIWRGGILMRGLRVVAGRAARSLTAREDSAIRRRIEENLHWQSVWDRAVLLPRSGREAEPVADRPARLVQDVDTGTLVRPDPLSAAADQRIYEGDYHGLIYLDERRDWPALLRDYQERRRRKIERVLPVPDRRAWGAKPTALDIGCGTGGLAAMLADEGFEVLGIEHSRQSVARARENFPHIRFAATGLEPLIEKGRTYDLVTLSHVLEHIHGDAAFLRDVAKVMHGASRLYVEVPLFTPDALAQRPGWFRQLDHHREYTRAGLHTVLQEAGFRVVKHEDAMRDPEMPEPFQYLCAAPPQNG